MTSLSCVLLGDINLDVVLPVRSYPAPGEDMLMNDAAMGVGGGIANTAIVLSRLGIDAVPLACVGVDTFGEQVLGWLGQAGVSTGGVVRCADKGTGVTFVVVTPDGERTMFSARGANALLPADAIPAGLVESAGLLHLSGYALLEAAQRGALFTAVQRAEAAGVPVSLDLQLDPLQRREEHVRRLLPHVSTLVVGLEEAAFLTGLDAPRPAAEALLGQGIRRVALKLGGKGGLLLGRKTEPGRRTEPGQDIMPGLECVELPIFTVRSIDTTGAGDSFCAGLIYGQLHGLDLAATGRLAAALGALATTVQGAGLALPGRDGVEALLGQPVGPAR